ncbi:hypothetical protein [Nocardioides limicola]|uniref:hypothetical protein n=1 Tax=Nocardioides limicola TaxID=2803368 RepID=UPI00193B7BAA|nr:hypothetical protein [Nocardioides sp. DJM-14]
MTTTTQTQAEARLALLPRAQGRDRGDGVAPLRDNGYRLVQVVLFWAGAVLLPTGLVVIILGWYGAAHTPYQYDQLSYLVSGGLLGVGLTFCGGFLYFGAWLARIAADQRESAKRLSDTLLMLAEVTSRVASVSGPKEVAGIPVIAGNGTTMHRRDCSLIAHREDLTPVPEDEAGHLTACRLCNP